METRRYYDEAATAYDARRLGRYHALVDDLEMELVERYAAGGRVLEAGCGTGRLLARAARFCPLAVGVDLSAGMLARAASQSLSVALADVAALPFSDDTFDAVFCFKVLPHVPDVRAALFELARVTRPGGHVLAEFYNPLSIRTLSRRLRGPLRVSGRATEADVHTRNHRPDEIRALLPATLTVVATRGIRVVTPFAQIFRLGPVARLFQGLERRLCDTALGRRFGGFHVVVAQKLRPPHM